MLKYIYFSFLVIPTIIAPATDGTFNSLFGTNGLVLSSYGQTTFSSAVGTSVAVDRNGKLLMAGRVTITGVDYMALARFNADGTSDNSFGTQGANASIANAFGYSVVIQSDDKIIVGGCIGGNQLILTRYESNGSVDTTFVMTPTISIDNTSLYLALQQDGKILVAANGNNRSILVRYNSNGSLDTTFTQADTNFGFFSARVAGLFVQHDGKIVIVGYVVDNVDNPYFLAARYLSNGLPDTTFGTQAGYITFGNNHGYTGALQADGKILIIGMDSSDHYLALARLTTQGLPDAAFGANGIVSTVLTVFPVGAALQSDGKILFAGDGGASYDQACVGRYTVNGVLDTSFGSNGLALSTPTGFAQFFWLALNAQGVITAVSCSDIYARLIQYRCDSLKYSALSQGVWQAYYNQVN